MGHVTIILNQGLSINNKLEIYLAPLIELGPTFFFGAERERERERRENTLFLFNK